MTYETFKRKISIIASTVGQIPVFVHDVEKGLYKALFDDKTQITGNGKSKKISVIWGSGHTAMAEV